MTQQELLQRMAQCHTWKTDLTPMVALAERLGNPQEHLKFVHVGGTNGKGSTCAMTAAVLEASGYRVGRFVSPYILEFRERIQINGEMIPETDLCRIGERVLNAVAELSKDSLYPTEFDVVTMIGFIWFLEQRCDIVVLEVGLGGAIDSTNVVPPYAVQVSAITSISLDHTAILGNTVEAIAKEKSGILKEGVPVVVGASAPAGVLSVIREAATLRRCPVIAVDRNAILQEESTLAGQRFSYKGIAYFVKLVGGYQLENTALVLELLSLIRQKGWKIPEEAVSFGLAHVVFPARMEVLNNSPLFCLDGAHNPEGAAALVDTLSRLTPNARRICINGMMGDKDCGGVLDVLAPLFSHVITLQPSLPRALDAAELASLWQQRGVSAEATASPEEAVSRAIALAGTDGVVVCCGSLYLCAEVRQAAQSYFLKK